MRQPELHCKSRVMQAFVRKMKGSTDDPIRCPRPPLLPCHPLRVRKATPPRAWPLPPHLTAQQPRSLVSPSALKAVPPLLLHPCRPLPLSLFKCPKLRARAPQPNLPPLLRWNRALWLFPVRPLLLDLAFLPLPRPLLRPRHLHPALSLTVSTLSVRSVLCWPSSPCFKRVRNDITTSPRLSSHLDSHGPYGTIFFIYPTTFGLVRGDDLRERIRNGCKDGLCAAIPL
jgi:hypothetical protein